MLRARSLVPGAAGGVPVSPVKTREAAKRKEGYSLVNPHVKR